MALTYDIIKCHYIKQYIMEEIFAFISMGRSKILIEHVIYVSVCCIDLKCHYDI